MPPLKTGGGAAAIPGCGIPGCGTPGCGMTAQASNTAPSAA
jgi:hypothetical protein